MVGTSQVGSPWSHSNPPPNSEFCRTCIEAVHHHMGDYMLVLGYRRRRATGSGSLCELFTCESTMRGRRSHTSLWFRGFRV